MESLALNFSYEGFFFSYLFDNAGIGVPGGEQYIHIDSGKLFVVIYPVDEKYYYNSLHSYIKRIRYKGLTILGPLDPGGIRTENLQY